MQFELPALAARIAFQNPPGLQTLFRESFCECIHHHKSRRQAISNIFFLKKICPFLRMFVGLKFFCSAIATISTLILKLIEGKFVDIHPFRDSNWQSKELLGNSGKKSPKKNKQFHNLVVELLPYFLSAS
jgi:hypothetical protein